jgi:hypothetical protein
VTQLPHGDDDPVEGSTSILIGASGMYANVTSQAIAVQPTSWKLPTSDSAYRHDLDFAETFRRTGATVQLRIDHDTS